MNQYAIDEANIALAREHHKCWLCGVSLHSTPSGRAHRISQTKQNIRKYGRYVIDNHRNIYMSCNRCNSYATKWKLDKNGDTLYLCSGVVSAKVSLFSGTEKKALIEKIMLDS